MKDLYIIRNYKTKDGNEKAQWVQAGVAFENKDGSLNVQIYMFPDVQFQIRERRAKDEDKGWQ